MIASSGAAATVERLLAGGATSRESSCLRLPGFYARPANGFWFPRRTLKMNGGRIACSASENGGKGLTYKDAGVDIDAGTELVRRIARMTPGIGGFGGLYPLGFWLLFGGIPPRDGQT